MKTIGLRRGALLRLTALQALALALTGVTAGTLLALAAARAVEALAPQYLVAVSGAATP